MTSKKRTTSKEFGGRSSFSATPVLKVSLGNRFWADLMASLPGSMPVI